MTSIYIVSGCRTPIGKFNGQFLGLSVNDLMKPVLHATIDRSGLEAPAISEAIIGNVLSAGKGQNPARQACVLAQLPIEMPATTVNMLCGSGLKSVVLGYNSIKSGESSVVMCGGMECMSQAEHSISLRGGIRIGQLVLKDTMIIDGLTDAIHNVHMGETAEYIARQYNISRAQQDQYAAQSQSKACAAVANGHFVEEIVGVRKEDNSVLCVDETPRANVTVQGLAQMAPAFVTDGTGTVTAGNSSGINDGAAAVLLANSFVVSAHNLNPLARIIGYAEVGIDPMIMGTSPIPAIQKLLQKIHWDIVDVDLFEINEAFAAQALIIIQELDLDATKVNVSGGAIALGHPIGASGCRILVTLIYNLRRLGLKRGVCALCVGGGLGIAMAIQMCPSVD